MGARMTSIRTSLNLIGEHYVVKAWWAPDEQAATICISKRGEPRTLREERPCVYSNMELMAQAEAILKDCEAVARIGKGKT